MSRTKLQSNKDEVTLEENPIGWTSKTEVKYIGIKLRVDCRWKNSGKWGWWVVEALASRFSISKHPSTHSPNYAPSPPHYPRTVLHHHQHYLTLPVFLPNSHLHRCLRAITSPYPGWSGTLVLAFQVFRLAACALCFWSLSPQGTACLLRHVYAPRLAGSVVLASTEFPPPDPQFALLV